MYPNDDIKYKIGFLNKKEQSGTMLSRPEFDYKRSVLEFSKYYESEILKHELSNISNYKKSFYEYLDSKELEFKQNLLKTRDMRKCNALQHGLEVINYLRNGGLKYFLYYVMDNYPFDNYDLCDYLSQSMINTQTSSYITANGNVYDYNPYTHKVTFNYALITLLVNIINGDRSLYNKVEKYYRLASKDVDNRETLINKLPVELRNINIDELNEFIKLLDKSNESLDINGAMLVFFKKFADLENDIYEDVHQEEIISNGCMMLDDLFANRIRINELEKYRVLDYFRDHKNLDICRNKFSRYHYNLEALVNSLTKNDFLSGADFYYDNTFNLPNINLACEYLSGRTKNYHAFRKFASTNDVSYVEKLPEDLFGADITSLDRIVYYGKNRINNPSNHDLDNALLDFEMLQAIGNYQASLNIKKEVEVPKQRAV